MNKYRLMTCVLGSMALVACGGGSDDASSDNNADVQGTWVLDCEADADGDSARIEYTFTDDTLTQAQVFYIGTTQCDNELTYALGINATTVIDGSTTITVDGTTANNIDLAFTPGYFTGSNLVLQALEAEGTSLEAIAAARGLNDINNIPLAAFEIESSERYSIYLVDGDQLQIGTSEGGLNGNSPDLRTNVLRDTVFTRL